MRNISIGRVGYLRHSFIAGFPTERVPDADGVSTRSATLPGAPLRSSARRLHPLPCEPGSAAPDLLSLSRPTCHSLFTGPVFCPAAHSWVYPPDLEHTELSQAQRRMNRSHRAVQAAGAYAQLTQGAALLPPSGVICFIKNDEEGHRAFFLVFGRTQTRCHASSKMMKRDTGPLFSFFGRIQKRCH